MKQQQWCLCKNTKCIHHKDVEGVKKVCSKGAGCPGIHCAFCRNPMEICWAHELEEGEADAPDWMIDI